MFHKTKNQIGFDACTKKSCMRTLCSGVSRYPREYSSLNHSRYRPLIGRGGLSGFNQHFFVLSCGVELFKSHRIKAT
jgi:hypothetical protein